MIRLSWSRFSSFAALALASALTGCNSNAGAISSAEPAAIAQAETAPEAAPSVALPQGAACSAAIGKWRDVIENDYRTGYVDPPVYGSAEKDIAQAQNACAAGHDAEAVRMVQGSRRRHGYPAN